jgi:hypothetical protein
MPPKPNSKNRPYQQKCIAFGHHIETGFDQYLIVDYLICGLQIWIILLILITKIVL